MTMDDAHRAAGDLALAINSLTNLNKDLADSAIADISHLEVEPLKDGFAKVSFVYRIVKD